MSTLTTVCPYCHAVCDLDAYNLARCANDCGGSVLCDGCRQYFVVRIYIGVDTAEELPLDQR